VECNTGRAVPQWGIRQGESGEPQHADVTRDGVLEASEICSSSSVVARNFPGTIFSDFIFHTTHGALHQHDTVARQYATSDSSGTIQYNQ